MAEARRLHAGDLISAAGWVGVLATPATVARFRVVQGMQDRAIARDATPPPLPLAMLADWHGKLVFAARRQNNKGMHDGSTLLQPPADTVM
jgi:hypothetical protein